LVEHGLSARGAIVDTAGSAEEAWNRMMGRSYDLVLCDSNLRGESGTELFQRIARDRASEVPRFVLMTGELLDSHQIASWEKKGARVLHKPFQISELISILEELLAASSTELKSIER
jgi:DNA-binding response OmpR family regulator